jgi:hypothetical protein
VEKTLVAACLLITGLCEAHAQTPDTLWSRIHSISPQGDSDDGKCVRQSDDGGFIIAGACVPDGMTSAIDVLLVKTDESGYIAWVKTFGREYVDEGLSVEQTFDGGFIIGGRALFVTGPLPASNHQSDVWLLKTDAEGDTLWTRNYGGPGHDYCTSIRQTPDSGYILAGTRNAGRSYPPECILDYRRSESERAWLIKTDQNGDTLWTRTYHVGSYANGVERTSEGGYVLVGFRASGTQCDLYIVKTNSVGDTVWTRTIGVPDSIEYGRSIKEVSDGYLIAGHVGPVGSGVDALVLKIDPSGQVLWRKTLGGDLSDVATSIDVAWNGEVVVGGMTHTQFHIHGGDGWIFRLDPEGTLLWERVYNISINDYIWSVVSTSDRSAVVCGFLGYGIGGDLWLAKIGQAPSDVPGSSPKPTRYLLHQNYPNPFNPVTTIRYQLLERKHVMLKVFNVLGEEVAMLVDEMQDSGSRSLDFNAQNLPSGVYLYRLTAGGFSTTRKMLVQK